MDEGLRRRGSGKDGGLGSVDSARVELMHGSDVVAVGVGRNSGTGAPLSASMTGRNGRKPKPVSTTMSSTRSTDVPDVCRLKWVKPRLAYPGDAGSDGFLRVPHDGMYPPNPEAGILPDRLSLLCHRLEPADKGSGGHGQDEENQSGAIVNGSM